MKQRLVGAIVLVALAVIFLPMLLDGSGQSGPSDVAIDIPDQPQPPPNRLDESRDTTAKDTDAATSRGADSPAGAEPQPGTMSEQPMPSEDSGNGDPATEQPSAGDAAPAPSMNTGASSATDSPDESSDDAATSESASATAPQPEPDDSESGDSADADEASSEASDDEADEAGAAAWVVQVGSFSRETNALVLRDRLRELEFDAFVERGETEQGTVWRVRVGPVSSKDEAERLSERVTEERGDPALVMTHP